jgi:molybdopterin molybdotransferase
MIKIEEALSIVKQNTTVLETEKIPFLASQHRVLAEDVFSDIDMPPFNKSAVDGYACRKDDLDKMLEIIEVIQAGQYPQKEIHTAECTQIMTGAAVPKGADTIVMVEDVSVENKLVKVLKKGSKSNISIKAEDVKKGQKVLEKGIVLKPQHIAILASVGYAEVLVYKQPSVGILSTGDELVEPHQEPGLGQIRNSNGHQLLMQVENCGAKTKYYGIAKDTEEDTYEKLSLALKENDLVLLSGGVSMGEFDFVPEIMKKLQIQILFDSIAVKPGKPTTFGVMKEKSCFGLPGNPVSSFIQFELLVKPLIFGMMGMKDEIKELSLPMGEDYCRKRAGRKAYFPVKIINGKVYPIKYHGSAHIHALSFADAFTSIPIGVECLKKGEYVDVRQI